MFTSMTLAAGAPARPFVLLASGDAVYARAILIDPHVPGARYCYVFDTPAGVPRRCYVAAGESADWYEVPDPLLAA